MKNSNLPKQTVAAFDFDGTITYHDSLLPFLIYVHGSLKTMLLLILELPALLAFLMGRKTRQEVKESILKRFFGGWKIGDVKQKGKEFAGRELNRHVRPEALEKLHWHLSQGHRCILISASIDAYLQPWAEQAGIGEILTSRLDTDASGIINGTLVGANCWGPEKVRRLMEVLGPQKDYILYAYGDSRGDKELLAQADFSFYRRMN